jgi:hypothetical protein
MAKFIRHRADTMTAVDPPGVRIPATSCTPPVPAGLSIGKEITCI